MHDDENKPRLRFVAGRGPPPSRKHAAKVIETQGADVERMAAAAQEIMRLSGLETHPDLLVKMAAQMLVELQEERRIIADRMRDLTTPPRAFTTADLLAIADDVEGAERDEKGAFAWESIEERD